MLEPWSWRAGQFPTAYVVRFTESTPMSIARPHSAAVREERFETLDARAGDELLVKARVDDPDVPGVDMLFAVLARDESAAGWISGSVFEEATARPRAKSGVGREGRERIPTNPGFVAAQVWRRPEPRSSSWVQPPSPPPPPTPSPPAASSHARVCSTVGHWAHACSKALRVALLIRCHGFLEGGLQQLSWRRHGPKRNKPPGCS